HASIALRIGSAAVSKLLRRCSYPGESALLQPGRQFQSLELAEVFPKRETAPRPFAQPRSQCRHAQFEGLADDVGLAQFCIGGGGSKLLGKRARAWNRNRSGFAF